MKQVQPEFPGFTITRKLLRGGMTDLYIALDVHHRRVLIRCPKSQYASDPMLCDRFTNAAKILGHLKHPHIVQIIDAGRRNGLPYMVLEYVESKNVRDLILHRDSFLTHNALAFIRQIAGALQYIHSRGYLHMDIKPENILVKEDGQVVLIDFDLARAHGAKPIKIKVLPGTPAYLAPETLAKHLVEERTDIFSFGVTAYEMLTLHKPFPGETADELRAAQLSPTVTPIPLKNFNPRVPQALESILFKCLAKSPDNRYPSMSLVVRDIEALI